MLSMILSYTLIIFLLLAIPVSRPLMQALDDHSLSWQEKALVSNDLLDIHARYWPWALGAGLVLVIHCLHSMWIVFHVAAPLHRLKSLFPQIGQGNLSIRTTLRKGEFLTSEAELVNQMTAQLDANVSAIKMAQAIVALDIDRLKQTSATAGNPTMAELVKKAEHNLADLKASRNSFKTHNGRRTQMSDWRTFPSATKPRVARHPTPEGFEHSGGFTLIELMLAVAIVGVLSSLAIPNYLGFVEKARVARAVAEMNAIAKEVRGYALSTELYPDSLAQIGRSAPLDPWGNPYQYYRINCGAAIIGRLDNLEPSAFGSAGLILPVNDFPPHNEAHPSFTVDNGNHHEARIYLTQAGGPPGGGAGGPPCGGIGGARKDRFLVPINSDFDLYSMGKDGQSVGPLTAQKSHDDVIRANDGSYYGLASNF